MLVMPQRFKPIQVLSFTLFLGVGILAHSPRVQAQDWSERADRFFGGLYYRITGQSCSEANYEEYNYAVCNLNYAHQNHENFRRYDGGSNFEFFEQVTNEIVFNAAAKQVYDMNKCQAEFFDLYQKNPEEKKDLNDRAWAQFQAIKSTVRTHDQAIEQRSSQLVTEMNTFACADNTSCGSQALEAMDRHHKDTDPHIQKLNQLVRSVPMGNRPEMRKFLVEASQKNLSEAEFRNGYEKVMGELKAQADNSYSNIKARSYLDANKGLVFRVGKNDEGASDFRRSLIENGLVQNVLLQNNMEERMKDGLMCRLHRDYSVGRNVRMGAEVAATFIVPYAAAALSLRAGLLAARAGSTVVRSSAMATEALMPAVLFGAGFGEGIINWRDVQEQCFPPEYLASKEFDTCNAEKQMYEVKAEASIASCVLSATLGIGLPVAGLRMGSKLARETAPAIDDIPEIVVTGTRARSRTQSSQRRTSSEVAPLRLVTPEKSSSVTEADIIQKYGTEALTTPAQNARFVELAQATNHKDGLLFVDTQNSMLKWLNDNLKDKSLVDALNNRHSLLLKESIEDLKARYPNLKIESYSDYKGIRFAVQGPPELEARLARDLQRATKKADEKFQKELQDYNLTSVTGDARDKPWFSTGVGDTADLANVQARFPPGTSWGDIQRTWRTVRGKRQALEARFGTSPLMRKVKGEVNASIPTAEVFEILRKNSDDELVAKILNHRHSMNLQPSDIQEFRQYAKDVDLFSPGLLVTSRVSHDYEGAIHGGLTLDFGGVGSLNAEATAEAMAQGFSLKRSVMMTRRNEKEVTAYLDKVKEQTELAVKEALEKRGISAQITVSGDDMVVIPSAPLSDEVKMEVLRAQSAAQIQLARETGQNTNVRISYFARGIPETTDRAILAAEGEGIEKILRNRLEFLLSPSELRALTFSMDMKGTTRGTGSVGLKTNTTLAPERQQLIIREFTEAVQEANKKFGSEFLAE